MSAKTKEKKFTAVLVDPDLKENALKEYEKRFGTRPIFQSLIKKLLVEFTKKS